MAEATTYTSLIDDMQRYMERGGVDDPNVYEQLPRFIMLAQKRLVKEAPDIVSTVPVTSIMEAGNPIIGKPARWRKTISFNMGTGTGYNTRVAIYERPYEFLRLYWSDPTQTGIPLYYADYDFEHWLVAPTPSLVFPFEVLIQEEPGPLDDSNQTNFYTQYAPDLLLHAALLESTMFLRRADLMQAEQAFYDRLLQGYGAEDAQRKDGDRSQDK